MFRRIASLFHQVVLPCGTDDDSTRVNQILLVVLPLFGFDYCANQQLCLSIPQHKVKSNVERHVVVFPRKELVSLSLPVYICSYIIIMQVDSI